MPYDFFLERYNEAYARETVAFCEALVSGAPAPCTGKDGLIALIMSMAAGKSAEEGRWVTFSEVVQSVVCTSPTECALVADSSMFPEGFKPKMKVEELLVIDPPERNIWQRMFGVGA